MMRNKGLLRKKERKEKFVKRLFKRMRITKRFSYLKEKKRKNEIIN